MKEILDSCLDAAGKEISVGDFVFFCPSGGGWRFGEGRIESIYREWGDFRKTWLYRVTIRTEHGHRTEKSNEGVLRHDISD